MNKDIKALLSIYTILILIGWNIGLSHKVDKEQKEKIEVMKVALKNDALNKEYIQVLKDSKDEVEKELYEMFLQNQDFKHLDKLQKDIARHTEER